MKKLNAILPAICLVSCAISAAFTACSSVEEADRLKPIDVIYRDTIPEPEPEPQDTINYFVPYQRHVLIEDFTGQDCVNCPNATDLIAQLQEMYGHDRVVAVGIHSGPLGVKATAKPEGLATDLGDTYYNYWKIEMQPYGVIDRSDGPLGTDIWTAKVSWDLAEEQWPAAQCNIFVEATTAGDSNQADIYVTLAGMKGTVNGKLQLWMTEDSITAFQKMPDGKTNNAYTHNHVLRDAINGTWGDDCSVEEEQLWQHHYTYTLPSEWKAENLSIVAFVYNDNGVVQAISTKMKNN